MTGAIRVVMAGGGTAGHTSPLIATAEQLQQLADVDILCIGTPKGLESRVIPEAGLELAMIPPVPLPRRPSGDLLRVPTRLRGAVTQSRALLRRHRAQVVVGFGGYVSLPVYLAARRERIPLVVHEGNAVAGLANRIAALFTPHVVTTFPATDLPHAQMLGLPVRAGIAQLDRAGRRAEGRAAFDLPETGRVLLVSGGSQGARSINRATAGAVQRLLSAGVSVLHVLGSANFSEANHAITDATTGAVYRPLAFISDMGLAYAAADLMVGRSGAATVMETAMTGLPTIFVPLAHGNGEQARNADFLVNARAGVRVEDAELTSDRLSAEVLALFSDPTRMRLMSDTCLALAPSGAAHALAQLVLNLAAGED